MMMMMMMMFCAMTVYLHGHCSSVPFLSRNEAIYLTSLPQLVQLTPSNTDTQFLQAKAVCQSLQCQV